jgi:hypothetical protein
MGKERMGGGGWERGGLGREGFEGPGLGRGRKLERVERERREYFVKGSRLVFRQGDFGNLVFLDP